ncbi:MAG: tRNA (cytidine(34)-2'-O)-methyltransferase [Clostridiales bacterium]|jgi:tRNA (cytidine/uridine-2'-O-)-methyltransferase|nr:tRNA (cytidine(34)-2'-O)-methyltransferase [Clostridiales bacterium]
MMNIVLYQPEIPHNTGAIARTCFLTGAKLHLVHPLGFFLDEKSVARAGLDYWNQIDIFEYRDFSDFLSKNSAARLILAESRIGRLYTEISYQIDDFIVFGGETRGIPAELLEKYEIVNIPMKNMGRSLNLSVSVGIILYEALRQNGFGDLA